MPKSNSKKEKYQILVFKTDIFSASFIDQLKQKLHYTKIYYKKGRQMDITLLIRDPHDNTFI